MLLARGCLVLVLLAATGCGGESAPTSPAPIPLVPVNVRVTPTPIRATFLQSDGTSSTFRATVDITFSDTAGAGARIQQLTTTTTKTVQTEQGVSIILGLSATTNEVHQIPAGGSVTQSQVLDFAVTSGETMTWRIQVSGVDAQGRSFLSSSAEIPVVLVLP